MKGSDIPAMTEDDWKILVSKQEIGMLVMMMVMLVVIVDSYDNDSDDDVDAEYNGVWLVLYLKSIYLDNGSFLTIHLYFYLFIDVVFARTSPEQKLTIVKEFTKAGNVTAMTGKQSV